MQLSWLSKQMNSYQHKIPQTIPFLLSQARVSRRRGGLCVCVCECVCVRVCVCGIIKAVHLPLVLSASPSCTVELARLCRERAPFFWPSWLAATVQVYLKLWFLCSFCLTPPIENTKWVWMEPNTAPSRFTSLLSELWPKEWKWLTVLMNKQIPTTGELHRSHTETLNFYY